MLSKILLCTIRGKKQSSLMDHLKKEKKEFCKQFHIHLLIRSQRPKTTGICNKDPN